MEYNNLSKLEQIELSEVLSQLGLNEKDRLVYYALLGTNITTITPLSKQLSLPLTTIQSVLLRLDKKGLVIVGKRKSRHTYTANDPQVLKKILQRQVEEVTSILPILGKLKNNEEVLGKTRVYYKERMTDIFHAALKCKNKTVYEIVSARDLQYILGEKFHFTRRRKKDKVYLKSLRVEKHEIKKYNKSIHAKELREAKFLPAELNFQSSIMQWDDTVAFFSSKNEGIAFVIESKSTSKMIKQIFELLWSVSRRMETV